MKQAVTGKMKLDRDGAEAGPELPFKVHKMCEMKRKKKRNRIKQLIGNLLIFHPPPGREHAIEPEWTFLFDDGQFAERLNGQAVVYDLLLSAGLEIFGRLRLDNYFPSCLWPFHNRRSQNAWSLEPGLQPKETKQGRQHLLNPHKILNTVSKLFTSQVRY